MKTLLKFTLSALLLTVATTYVNATSSNCLLTSIELIETKGPYKLTPSTVLKGKSFLVSFSKYAGTIKSVSIKNFYGEVLFSEKQTYTGNFKKTYNMKKLNPGSYVVVIKTATDTFYNWVRL